MPAVIGRLAVVVLIAACGSKDSAPADCSTVANGVRQYWADRRAQTTDPDELAAIDDTVRTSSERFERHCVADHWNPDMIACARAVFRLEDSGCMKYMSVLQRAKLQDEEAAAPAIHGGIGVGP